MFSRRGFMNMVAATAALSIAGARLQLGALTADDIMTRYTEVRSSVGDLTFGQKVVLVVAVQQWIKERAPDRLETRHVDNWNLFSQDHLRERLSKRLLLRIFTAYMSSKNPDVIIRYHHGTDTEVLMQAIGEREAAKRSSLSKDDEAWGDYFFLDPK